MLVEHALPPVVEVLRSVWVTATWQEILRRVLSILGHVLLLTNSLPVAAGVHCTQVTRGWTELPPPGHLLLDQASIYLSLFGPVVRPANPLPLELAEITTMLTGKGFLSTFMAALPKISHPCSIADWIY